MCSCKLLHDGVYHKGSDGQIWNHYSSPECVPKHEWTSPEKATYLIQGRMQMHFCIYCASAANFSSPNYLQVKQIFWGLIDFRAPPRLPFLDNKRIVFGHGQSDFP